MRRPVSRQEFATTLRDARHRSGLSLRALARKVGLSASTVQGWLEGKHLPTLALQDEFLTLVRTLDLTAKVPEDEWLLTLAQLRGLGQVGTNPYVGLRSFGPEDADHYFGRDAILDEVVDAVRAAEEKPVSGLVAVVGVSGSGKSSLLQAGLIGRECGSGRLRDHTPVLVQVLDVHAWQAPAEGRILLVVDHVETLRNEHPDVIEDALYALGSQPSNVVCVFSLAAHAFELVASDSRLRRALAAPILVGAMNEDELRDVIVKPARVSGRPVEGSLVTLIVRYLWQYGVPPASVLPVLSNSLHQSWALAKGPTVTVPDYLAAGGLWGSLERLAEGIYERASPEGQRHIRKLFLDLVQVTSDGIERRSMDVAAIPEDVVAVTEDYLNARLLMLEGNLVSVAHSALLERWQRLGTWVDEEREQLMFRRRIGKAAEVWAESNRDPQALIPVEALVFDQFARSTDIALTPLETDFFEASVARAEAESEQQRLEIVKLRRRNIIYVVLVITAAIGLLLGGVMVRRAESFQVAAEQARAEAQSRQLALIAEEMRPTDRNVAAQLSLAAHHTAATMEARAAVLKSAGLEIPHRVLGEPGTVRLAAAPDGSLLVRVSADGTLEGWRDGVLTRHAFVTQITRGQLFGVAYGEHEGRQLVAVAGQQTASVWDVTGEPRLVAELGDHTVAYSAGFGAGTAYLGMLDGTILRFDLTSGAPLEPLDTGTGVAVETVSATVDGAAVAASGGDNLLIWQDGNPAPQVIDTEARIMSIQFAPDGRTLATGGSSGWVSLFDVPTAGPATQLMHRQFEGITVHALSYDGQRIVVGVWDGTIGAFTRDGLHLATFNETSTVTGLTTLAGRVVTGTIDGTMRLWPERYAGLLVEGSASMRPTAFAGERIITYFDDYVGIFGLDGAPEARLPFVEDVGTGQGAALGEDHVISLPTNSGRLAAWDLRQPDGGQPEFSQVADDNAYELYAGPGGWGAYAERSKSHVTVIKRTGLEWDVVTTVPTWSTLAMGWHPTRPWLAAMSEDSRRLVLHDLSSGEARTLGEVEVPKHGASIRLAWAPHGQHLYIGTDGGLVFRVEISADGVPTLRGGSVNVSAGVASIGVSHDGASVAAGLQDGRVFIWNHNGGSYDVEAALRPSRGSVAEIHLHDTSVIFTTDVEGIYSWPLNLESAVAHLCAGIGDPLTAEEWERAVPGVDPVDGCAN